MFLVAGEPSGDNLAARLMAALKRRTGGEVRFAGVGGEAMAGEGLESLFPMGELSVMGFAEILPRIPRLLSRLREAAAAIRARRPDAVVTVDSPGFSLRLARRVRGEGIPLLHYVAPQLWAWRPGRAKELARLVDHLLVLFPFETGFFEKTGLACTFVGHPVIESGAGRGDGPGFRVRHGIAPEAPLVCLMPGSRHTEIRAHLAIFGRALEILSKRHPGLRAIVPTVHTVADAVGEATARWRAPAMPIVLGADEKYDGFAASDAALTKSVTGSTELALANVPMVVAYKVNPVTGVLARRLIRVPHVALVNLLLERELVPEFLQDACTPERLAAALSRLLEDEGLCAAQAEGFAEVRRLLGGGGSPSDRAAEVVLSVIAQRQGA